MKRALKKTMFMVKGTKKRLLKKSGIKHIHSTPRVMITNSIVSAVDLSQNSVGMGTSQYTEETNKQ